MGANDLIFREADHSYWLAGARLPSVTQVLSVLTGDYLARIPPDVLERKRQIGTAVHLAIHLDLNGELEEASVAEPWAGYFRGWRKFYADAGLTEADVGEGEKPLAHALYGYAGTRDVPLYIDKRWAMVDLKCTADLHPAVGPQTAAYFELENANTPKSERKLQDRYALHLKPDGKYRLEPLKDKADFQTFLSALNVYRWKQRYLKEPA